MKSKLAGLILLAASAGLAKDVTLGWSASPTSGVTNYTLYASSAAITPTHIPATATKVNCGTNLIGTVTTSGQGTWYFAVDAVKGGLHSDAAVISAEFPAAPANLKVVP